MLRQCIPDRIICGWLLPDVRRKVFAGGPPAKTYCLTSLSRSVTIYKSSRTLWAHEDTVTAYLLVRYFARDDEAEVVPAVREGAVVTVSAVPIIRKERSAGLTHVLSLPLIAWGKKFLRML